MIMLRPPALPAVYTSGFPSSPFPPPLSLLPSCYKGKRQQRLTVGEACSKGSSSSNSSGGGGSRSSSSSGVAGDNTSRGSSSAVGSGVHEERESVAMALCSLPGALTGAGVEVEMEVEAGLGTRVEVEVEGRAGVEVEVGGRAGKGACGGSGSGMGGEGRFGCVLGTLVEKEGKKDEGGANKARLTETREEGGSRARDMRVIARAGVARSAEGAE